MDILIQRDALLKPLQAVCGIVEKKQTQAILSNVLLSVQDDELHIVATDNEIELVGFVALDAVTTPGEVTVSARKLFDICRTLSEGVTVRLFLEKNYLSISALETSFSLNTLPVEDFPSLEQSEYEAQFVIKQSHLKHLLSKTCFAMGQQDVRLYLNGAFLDISHGMVKCVAADGHRLALTSIQDEKIGNIKANVILPRKSVLELIRLLGNEADHEMSVLLSEQRMRFITAEYRFTSKLINATYPDYNRLIPKGFITATGDRDAIKQALIRAAILSNEKFRGVSMQLEPGKLRVMANNSDQEQAEDAVPLQYEGEQMKIAFNVSYLLDAVSAMSAKLIRMIFTGPNEGILIEPVLESDHSRYIIMPMRL